MADTTLDTSPYVTRFKNRNLKHSRIRRNRIRRNLGLHGYDGVQTEGGGGGKGRRHGHKIQPYSTQFNGLTVFESNHYLPLPNEPGVSLVQRPARVLCAGPEVPCAGPRHFQVCSRCTPTSSFWFAQSQYVATRRAAARHLPAPLWSP